MAFIFVPNADGSFTEGDKQTNPDTGVEYIYSDGAWRALGPKIEDEFDTLDDRYIKLNGRSDVGDAYTIKGPGETTGATSTFHQIKDGKQYLYHIDTPQDSNTEWVANVSYVKSKTDDKMSKQGTQNIHQDHWKIIQPNQDGNNRTFVDIYDGEMNLYNIADPTGGADGWATNKKYVKDNFIGNKGTQTLNADSWNIKQPNSTGGNNNFIVIHDGQMNLYNVVTADDSKPRWAANVEYVQNAIEAIDSASVTIDNVPPSNPNSGDLWFHSGEADLKIYYTDDTSSQWIPASTPPDPYDENFVSTSGDTMTGDLRLDNSKLYIEGGSSRLYAKNDDGDITLTVFPSGLLIANNTVRAKRINNGDLCFAAIQTDGVDSANDVYKFKVSADGRAHSEYTITSSSDNKTLVTKKYVADELSKISDDRPKGMPGTAYKYSNSYGDSLPDGHFHIAGNGAVYMSRKSFDGIEMSSYQTDDRSSSVRVMVHVRGSDGRVLHSLVSSHWYQGVGSNKRIEFAVSSRIRDGKSEMVAGRIYYITDGVFNF